MINKILVPVDGSKIALRALEFAMEIGRKFASQILVVNIDVPYDLSRIKPPHKTSTRLNGFVPKQKRTMWT